jgi:hypothetical protein
MGWNQYGSGAAASSYTWLFMKVQNLKKTLKIQ